MSLIEWAQLGATGVVCILLAWMITQGNPKTQEATLVATTKARGDEITAMALVVEQYTTRAEIHRKELHDEREQMHAERMGFAAAQLKLAESMSFLKIELALQRAMIENAIRKDK